LREWVRPNFLDCTVLHRKTAQKQRGWRKCANQFHTCASLIHMYGSAFSADGELSPKNPFPRFRRCPRPGIPRQSEAFPLLRYRTRDICVLSRKKCSCGRTLIKMTKPMGRSDDMMIIRGVNVFPSQIETVLLNEGYSPNYQIIIDRKNNSDTLDVNVELSPEMFSDTVKSVTDREKKLADAMRTMIGIGPNVHLVPPKTIARSEGKAVRVIDKRKLI